MTDEELRSAATRAKAEGEHAARSATTDAPADPLLRVAWFLGFEDDDAVRHAVAAARAAGATWAQIAIAADEPDLKAAETHYGGGAARARRYRARKRGETQGSS